MAERYLSKAALESHHGLEGLKLASPRRRLAAFLLDALILLLPTAAMVIAVSLGGLWVFDRPVLDVLRRGLVIEEDVSGGERIERRAELAELLVEKEADGVPPELTVAVVQGERERAAELLEGLSLTLGFSGEEKTSLPPNTVRLNMRTLLPVWARPVATFGVAALYYVFFLSGPRRATPGKRLMRLEVLKLDGKPLSAWDAFERFGGYLASLGTLGIGLFDFWRDRNRRLAHDRIAQTVVVHRARRV